MNIPTGNETFNSLWWPPSGQESKDVIEKEPQRVPFVTLDGVFL